MADVLLVDDNGNVRLVIATALRRFGHAVTVAGDAQQALTNLQRQRFAFLVTDVRMAGMNGIELAIQARQLPHPPRVILMSAYSNIEAHEGLAEAFLRKPIDIQELHDLLCDQEPVNTSAESRNGNDSAAVKVRTTARSESTSAKLHTSADSDTSARDALPGEATSRNATPRGDSSGRRSVRTSYGTIFG